MTFRVRINVRPKPSNVVAMVPTASSTLAALIGENLQDVLVIGLRQGQPYIAASFADEMKAMRLVETARNWLLQGDVA